VKHFEINLTMPTTGLTIFAMPDERMLSGWILNPRAGQFDGAPHSLIATFYVFFRNLP
jgi:hypothetical protein